MFHRAMLIFYSCQNKQHYSVLQVLNIQGYVLLKVPKEVKQRKTLTIQRKMRTAIQVRQLLPQLAQAQRKIACRHFVKAGH